jgi:hypothetical protein
MQESGDFHGDISSNYVNGWHPNAANGTAATSYWPRGGDHQSGADVCWDATGSQLPAGLNPMTADEKDVSFF